MSIQSEIILNTVTVNLGLVTDTLLLSSVDTALTKAVIYNKNADLV